MRPSRLLPPELICSSINEVHVVAGAALNGALPETGLVDEWIPYLAPLAVGHDARELFNRTPLESLNHAARFRLDDVRQIGDGLRLTLLPGV